MSCANSGFEHKWLQYKFPDNRVEIETELLRRPHHRHMNWTNETIEELKEELANGLE